MPETEPKFGSIVHIEYHSTAPDKTQQFYEKVFGWRFEKWTGGGDAQDYRVFQAPGEPNGGLIANMPGAPAQTITYILVESIDKVLKKAQAAGATVGLPKTAVADMGWMAALQVPGGFVQGLWEVDPKGMRA